MTRFKAGVETEQKERDFRGLLGGIHIPICEAIRASKGKPHDPPYLFVDLHGGPGDLDYNGRNFQGSPLIAIELLQVSSLPFETIHFEHDHATVTDLRAAVARTGSRSSSVKSEPFETGMRNWLERTGRQPWRFGVVYSDPIAEPIPVDTFNEVARYLPKVDLLAYVSATNQYKRACANGGGHGRRLADDVHAVDKTHVLIRESTRAEQYTFIVWTNWTDFPAWTKRGFHALSSPRGQRVLEQLTWTKAELHERTNTPLPFEPESYYQPPDPGDAPYRGYREYLKHPRFLKIRAVVFDRAAGLCERCHARPPTEPHHLRYPPWGTFDVPENMIAVCHQCHCDIHGKAA